MPGQQNRRNIGRTKREAPRHLPRGPGRGYGGLIGNVKTPSRG
jgi:hypothetical protein